MSHEIPTRPPAAMPAPPSPGDAAAAGGAERFQIAITVDTDLSADLRLFLGKTQLGDPFSACSHPRAVRFIAALCVQIDSAKAGG